MKTPEIQQRALEYLEYNDCDIKHEFRRVSPHKYKSNYGVTCFRYSYGYVNIGVEGIRGIAVKPELHGKGYGAKLVAKAERFMRKNGKTQSSLATYDDTVKFYEKLGYKRTNDKFPFIMVKDLQ